MHYAFLRTFLAVLFGFVLTATGVWASPAGEEEPAAAMEKEMVTDPATGKAVTAPEYGGTLTKASVSFGEHADPFYGTGVHFFLAGVSERLSVEDWAIDRDEEAFQTWYRPAFFHGTTVGGKLGNP